MKIAIATDHRGVDFKKQIMNHFDGKYEFIDCSQNNYDTDDYPDFAFAVCKAVNEGKADAGILLCGTGIGMSIAANKVKGIRCALVHDYEDARLAKEHNNANVIALGTKLNIKKIYKCISTYLEADASEEEKHKNRINKIINYENGEYHEL